MPANPTREDSGLIDLDALLREAHESGPIPHADESGERLVVRPAPAPVRAREDEPAPPPSAPAPDVAPRTAPARASAPLPPSPKKRGVLPVAGAMVLALALATGALFWSTRRPSSIAVAPIADPTQQPAAPVTAVTASPAPAEVATGVSDLPSVAPEASAASSAASPVVAHVRAHASARPEAAVAVSDVTTDAPPNAAGDLGRAMHDAVGVREDLRKQETNGAGSSGARQLRPSPGAVVGAINAVLPAARACLGPDDPVRSGVLVFNSDGTVARVDLRGERPQDECIRAAMARARIEPFVDETFTTRITVRP